MTLIRFTVRFCKKLWFSVLFRFYKINCGFSFFLFGFCTLCCLMCMHSTECFPVYCLLQCWLSLTNSQPKWLRSRSAEIRHEKNTLIVYPIMLEDELWVRLHEKPSQTAKIVFLKTEMWKLSFRFLNFEISLVQFLENQYPTFSSGSAHPNI